MPLPGNNQPFIPDEWEKIYQTYEEWAAWYAGSAEMLSDIYSRQAYRNTPLGQFWARDIWKKRRTTVHVPLAGDISSVSSDLLFGEEPTFKIPETEEGETGSNQAQDRLDTILEANGIYNKLVEAADICSGISGVFLKVNWNKDIGDFPLLSIAPADNAIPEFQHGFLTAVTFRKIIDMDDYEVLRLVERHEMRNGKAYLLNGLYKGTIDRLGKQIPLKKHKATENLQDELNTRLDTLLVRYIPNMKPNRKYRWADIGRSDYDGTEGLMNSLDETWSSWMRDIRLGKGRLVVPDSWLKKDENGNLSFDVEEEAFTEIDVDPLSAGEKGLTVAQFNVRAKEHRDTAIGLIERIISHAGYSLSSFGVKDEGGMMTATEVSAKESKSFKTTKRKQRYWKQPLQDILGIMLKVDRLILKNPTPADFVPNVEFGNIVAFDPKQTAETIEMLNRAQAITNETKVKMAHPDWTQEQIDTEVEELNNSQGLNMEDPTQIGIG